MSYAEKYRQSDKSDSGLGSLYHQIGGAETIDRLVHAFYSKVYAHPLLRPLFPDGVDEIRAKQYLFLTQFTGGPSLYTDRFGFGNMRSIHEQFPITPERADAWLSCMKEAMEEIGLEGHASQWLHQMLSQAAHRFVNTPPDESTL